MANLSEFIHGNAGEPVRLEALTDRQTQVTLIWHNKSGAVVARGEIRIDPE